MSLQARTFIATPIIGAVGKFLGRRSEAPPALWMVPAILPRCLLRQPCSRCSQKPKACAGDRLSSPASGTGVAAARLTQIDGSKAERFPSEREQVSSLSLAMGLTTIVTTICVCPPKSAQVQKPYFKETGRLRTSLDALPIPHLLGAKNRFPTGQRGILYIWRSSLGVTKPNAQLDLLRIAS
jgi:hypothetical protein